MELKIRGHFAFRLCVLASQIATTLCSCVTDSYNTPQDGVHPNDSQ